MRFVLANYVYFCFLFYCSIVDLQCCINHFCSAKWFSYTYMWWFSSLSRVWLFATPWTVASQAAQSMGFSRQEYWNGLPFPSQGIFLTQGSKLHLLHWQMDSSPLSHLLCNFLVVRSLSRVLDCSMAGKPSCLLSVVASGNEPGLLLWERGVLSTGPPGKSLSGNSCLRYV